MTEVIERIADLVEQAIDWLHNELDMAVPVVKVAIGNDIGLF